MRLGSQTVLENRYQVIRLMTEGETANVYEGRHLGLDLPIVIKQLRALYPDPQQAKEQAEQYQIEARLLAKLKHPNLVLVYDTFVANGLPLLVMEMVRGRNLQEIGELAPKPLSERRVLLWAKQLLETLTFLHTQPTPVIVRGLQPSNLVLDDAGRLRLIDFGLAKAMDDRGAGTRNIIKGLGEDGYAPLEQGAYSKTDARSDLYSLGAILYFLLTKTTPPSAAQRTIAPKDPLRDPREINPTVSQETWQAIQAMMQLRAGERPSSAAEAADLFPEAEQTKVRKCVDCNQALSLKVLDEVEIDSCDVCGGIWLDKGELERLRKRTEMVAERSAELLRTVALSPDHPALKALQEEQKDNQSFWSTLHRLFGVRGAG